MAGDLRHCHYTAGVPASAVVNEGLFLPVDWAGGLGAVPGSTVTPQNSLFGRQAMGWRDRVCLPPHDLLAA